MGHEMLQRGAHALRRATPPLPRPQAGPACRPRALPCALRAAPDGKQAGQSQQPALAADAAGAAPVGFSPLTAPGGDIEGPSTDLSVIYERLVKVCAL
jgi:hypothetical protein